MTAVRQHPMVAGTSTTEGEASYLVDGSYAPHRPFSTIASGRKIRYVAQDGAQFEEGYGTVSAGPTLSRTTILHNSAGDTDKIDWGTGTRIVYPVPDIDTIYELDDNGYCRFFADIQLEAETKKFRWWRSNPTGDILYLSETSGESFDNLITYNAAAGTPTFVFSKAVDLGSGSKLNGTALQAPATSAFASEVQAQAGSSEVVVANPLRVAQAIATDTLLIGGRTAGSEAFYTDEVVVKLTGGGLQRKTLAMVDQLMNTPDYESLGNALNAGPVVKTHGLGSKPRRVRWALTCISADADHAVGDSIVDLAWQTASDATQGLTVVVNATQIKFLFLGLRAVEPDNSTVTVLDLAKWQVDIWAWIGGAAP